MLVTTKMIVGATMVWKFFLELFFLETAQFLILKIDVKNCATSRKKLGVHVTDTEKVQIRF